MNLFNQIVDKSSEGVIDDKTYGMSTYDIAYESLKIVIENIFNMELLYGMGMACE